MTLETNILVNPPVHRDLVVKMTHSGITVLKNDKFRNRVTGSRSFTLLPDATLVDNRTKDVMEYRAPDPGKRPAGKLVQKKVPPGEGDTQQTDKIKYKVNKKLIRARVAMFIQAMKKPVLHAITISFPKQVTDDMGYQMLNTWLTVAREKLHLREYLWVAERQEVGTIHFHVLIPQYFNIVQANRIMRACLATQIRKGNVPGYSLPQCKRYNGVDISKNRTTKRVTDFAKGSNRKALTNYITKYISKNDEGFAHYAWHNSRGFSAQMTGMALTEAEARLYGIRGHLNMDRVFAGEYAYFIPWKNGMPDFFRKSMAFINSQILNKGPADSCQEKLSFIVNLKKQLDGNKN